MKLKIQKIEVSSTHRLKLAKENRCTRQAVHNSLNYFSDSELSRRIRKSAKQLLIKEANNIVIKIK